ncbi:MAG: RHS repeat-associated core domain-containing protein [Clostridia bacterium]|nr:RHS repeat-associated core domain-containing protein [Clostridia bacterium]
MGIRKIDTADSCIYELIVYNPDSGRWYIPDGLSIVSANSGLGCAISQTQGEPVKAVILAGKVLYRDTEGRWEEKFTIPDGLSAKGIETIRFPSPQYFLYQLNTGESSIKTVIYFLKNGEVVSKRTELPGESMFMGADSVNGLVGHNAFVSYLGGNQTEQADTFYLRRVVSGAVKDKQAGCIVKSITLNNGYMDIMTGFRFEESSACIDSSGLLCRFNKASVLWGTDNPEQASYGYTEHCFFNGLTKEESPAVPYPSELDYTNAGDYYSTVKGLKYCMYIYDSSNNLVSSIKDFWWVYMNNSGNTTGFYVRKNKQEKMLDGVTGTTEYLYSRDTGLLLETCTYNYNALDELEKLTQQFKYWWEVYDTERSLNLLTPVVQTTCKVKNMDKASETTVSSNVTTWKKEWGQGKDQWFPYKSFCALNGDVMPFNAWGEDDNPPTGEWLEVGSTELITSSGMILESKDAKGISTTRIYDQDGFFVTTEIQNASFASNDLSYLGFETYEDIGGWGNSSSQALVDNIIDWDYYTGSRCLKLNAAPVEGLFRSDNLHRAYVFGCNAKVENGFNSNNGKALWEIAVYKVTDNTEVGTVLTIDLSSAVGKWDYFQKTIDLEQIRESNDLPQDTELYFIIKGYNLNQTKYCLVDNLRVLPTDALFSAAVYEPSDLRIKAVLDNNGQAENILYNAFLRPIAAINAKQGINAISIAAYSRNLFGTDSFKQQFPNLNLVLGTSSDSSYDDFHDGSLEGWKFTDPQKWGISKNELTYTGTSSAPLGEKAILDTWAYTNFAFRIIVKRQSSTPSASVAIGDGYYLVRWKEDGQNSQWELSRLDTSGTAEVLATFTEIGFKEEWIFIVVDGFVMFYADGIPIFCYKYEPPSSAPQDYGKPTMYIDKPGAFDEMIILREPQLSIGFEDGFGTTMQSFALAGRENAGIFQGDYSVAWQGAYFDDLGRIQYICNPLTAKVALAPYERSTDSAVNRGVTSGGNSAENNAENSAELIEGDTDTYLYDSQGQKLSKSEYLSADVIDYCTQIYEPSPLSRISQILLPREKASDIDLFTTSILRTGSSSIETANPSQDGLLNRFYVEKISKVQSTDKNNVKSYIEKIVMYDLTGKIVRELVGKEGAYREKRYIYNASGDLATIRHPNYFDASFGSEQVGFADTMEYTFAGLLKKHTTPDSNTTEYIYDKVGELRFVLDAEGAKQNPQRIAYLKYDSSKRVIETGYISDPAYPWGAGGGELQPYADNPSFPVTEPSQLQNSNYAVGLWKKRFFYDMDLENPDTKYMLGRLWKVQVNNGGQAADEEYYRYDSLGNIISQSVKSGGFDNKIYEFNYEYNNQGRVISVIYPSQGEAPFKVGYYYDRLGRQACIGEVVDKGAVVDPSNPPTPPESRYASYYHNSSGFMVRELLNNSPDPSASNSIIRDYSFNNKGMLKKIKDGYFEETLDYYENGGYNDFKYYDGNIASLSFNYKTGAGNQSFPGKYNYKFQYDSSGRLVNGIHSLGNAWSVIEPADSPSYDANGNILKQKRGATTKTYQYAAAENAQINNRVQSIESSIDAALDFEGLEPAAVSYGDWNWGSSNGGASESGIFTDDKHSGTQCLRLTGGSLGHYEFLLLKTFLEPVESLKLTYWLKTSPGFDQYRGDAGWLISIYSAAGGIFTKNIKTVAAAEDWTKEEVEINLRGLVDSLGSGEEVCYATLELRNCKGASNQESQVYLLVDDISINGRGASQNHEYNYNGDITKSPERGIDIIYDPITRLTTSIKINGTANSLEFAYGASNQRLLEELKSSDSSESFKKLYLNGLNSSPLMEKTNIGGVEKTTYYIYGRNGLLAAKTDEKWIYPLKDHLGSARMLVEEDGNVKNWYDYMPFGELMGKDEADGINYLYTGQEYDAQSGLYNYRARFYDPALKRFYGTDPAGQYACPYVYTGNNPVNRIDPTGCIDFTSGLSYIESAVMAVLLAYLGYKGLLIYSLIKRHDASEGKIPLNSGKIFQDYIDKYVSYEWNWGKDGYKKRERIGILQQANDSNVMRLYNPLLKEEKLISFVLSREEPGQLYRKFNFVLLPVNGQKEIRLAEVNSCFEDREINVYHSELAKGLKVDCAGELIIDHAYGDKIWTVERVYLKPKTGHYYKLKGEPAYEEFENCPNIVIEEMKRLGYTNIKKEKYGG